MKQTTIVILFCLLMAACKKDGPSSDTTPRISKISASGTVKSEFFYDGSNRFIRYVAYASGTIRASEIRRTYDASGKVTRIDNLVNVSGSTTTEQMDSTYSLLTYDASGRLQDTKTYKVGTGGTATFISKAVPEYDNSGKTISLTLYDANNYGYLKNTFQYDGNNNVTTQDEYQPNSGPTIAIHRTYEYDTYKNPLKDIWILPWGVNQNNITKQTSQNFNSIPMPVTTVTVTTFKTYDSNGYPTLVNEGGVDYTYTYK